MENKNNTVLLSAAFLIIGFLVGWLVFGNKTPEISSNSHMMGNGQMMQNEMMSMGDAMQKMTASLYGKTGSEFDKAFIDEMIVHHEGAVEMAQLALKNGGRKEIKDMANGILSAQTSEINQMKMWRSSWYGN